jgi:bifunctional non-homologous end joining protein LigD
MNRLPRRTPESTHEQLRAYQAKRNFLLTSEPADGGQPGVDQLTFVVQKHWASSLHYDFRLELDGAMKSWAVPKGPSFDPSVKRMAVQVEDHPLAYAEFEGTIPAEQYGAGKVIVWDAGTWSPVQDPHQGLRDGNLKFDLHGHKLNGRWVLVRMKDHGEKQAPWLLIKEKDAHARASSEFSVVDELPGSVQSLASSAAGPSVVVPADQSVADQGAADRVAAATSSAAEGVADAGFPAEAVPAALPRKLSPQLATLVTGPPPDVAEWLFEIKFDGYRMLVRNDDTGARLLTRNGHDWTARLLPLQHEFERLALPPGWYDGEIVLPSALDIPDFGALQQAFQVHRTDDVVLYLFDLPYLAGYDLRNAPLAARRSLLQALLAPATSDHVRFSEEFDAAAQSVLASACKLGLEGIIAKRRSSTYRSARSIEWVKLKCGQRQEFVIGGYSAPQGARVGFGALLLGVNDAQGALQFAGEVGAGFTDRALKDIKRALDSQLQAVSPFAEASRFDGVPTWVVPTLVAEVSFGEWTRAGRIRHAVFRGLRQDKPASIIVRERAQHLPINPPMENFAVPLANPLSDDFQITHPQRVIDTRSGVTKLELLRYYSLVGDLMLKHLKSRPVALVRAPDGVDGQLFFQKHADTTKLNGIRQLDPSLDPGHPPMIEVVNKRGLLSAAQWNVIEFHTLNSGTLSLAHPDRMVFDLDPGEGVSWALLQQAAVLMQSLLAQLGLPAFLKTSGGKGLHVVVPVKRLHDWDTVKGFSQAVVGHMVKTIPQRFVARSGPKHRVGRIFIDYLRNGFGATTVCAWSARARPGLGISVPVAWEELPSLRGGDHWSVKTVHQRLDIGNDPWSGYANAARGLMGAMAALGFVPGHAGIAVTAR